MKYKIISLFLSSLFIGNLLAQETILSPNSTCINCADNRDASSVFEIQSTDKGMLIPRMSEAQRMAINTPAKGLLVFDNTTNSFWFYNGTEWEELGASSATSGNSYWAIDGEDIKHTNIGNVAITGRCLLYTSPSPRDATLSRMPSSA